MDDSKIIDLLFERSESGLALIEQKYKGLSLHILSGILSDFADAEECYNDLLVAVWNSIPPERPRSLTAYICTLTRRIGINRYKHNHREKRDGYRLMLSELDEAIPDPTQDAKSRSEVITEALNRFAVSLDREGRILFLRRYVYMESVTELAERFQMSENAVSSRLFRIRKRLKAFLREENIEV